jgi:hypothetical protein
LLRASLVCQALALGEGGNDEFEWCRPPAALSDRRASRRKGVGLSATLSRRTRSFKREGESAAEKAHEKIMGAYARPDARAARLAKTRNLRMARSSHAYDVVELALGVVPAQQEPTSAPSLRKEKPTTAQSAVCNRLTLIIARSPLKYDPFNLLRHTPSLPP